MNNDENIFNKYNELKTRLKENRIKKVEKKVEIDRVYF